MPKHRDDHEVTHFGNREKLEQLLSEKVVVSIITSDVGKKLVGIL